MKFIKYYNAGISDAVLYGLSEKFGLPIKVVQLLVARGYKTEKQIKQFINPTLDMLYDPFKLKNMDKAVQRVKQAISNKQKILVFGDYDVDGVSATAIMLKMFEKLNYKVNFYLPNRYVDGYGLTTDVLDKIKSQYNPNLIVTVDCGISAYEEVEYGKKLGIDFVITDHHEIPQNMPQTIVVNPKLPDQEYGFRELCGTGVAFKFAQAMLGEAALEFLPIAAIATIADIVPLVDENRIIVKLGMASMEKHLPLGIKAMLKEHKLTCQTVTSTDIAFKIAPKLNASGRMGDAKDSLDLYLEKNPTKIKSLIADILLHNTNRQELCNVVYQDCKKMLANVNMSEQKCIILASDKWDQGILGIVCARLLDEYNRPVFLFSNVDGLLKGSARSLPDVNVHELLTDMQDILETFGGHTVAAGMSLQAEKFEEFKVRVNSYIHQHINDKAFIPISYYDENITLEEIDQNLIKALGVLEPLGCDNQPPRFKLDTSNVCVSPMKNFANHANLTMGKNLNLVAFNYTNDYYKLKYAQNKSFVFELQDNKFKSPYIKGLLKEFGCDFGLVDKNLNAEAFYLGQLAHLNNKGKAQFSQYESKDLVKFVTNTALSAFGTCFVFFNNQTLKNFAKQYDLENIYNFEVGENISNTGFNSILFAPQSIDFAKNYQNIIFVDPVLDKGYLAAINQISNAKLFVPANQKFDKNIFSKIYLGRDNFARIYTIFKKVENIEWPNLELMYQEFYRNKINFYDFYTAMLVFCELGLLKVLRTDTVCVTTISDKKVPLAQSNIYNFISLIKNTK